MTARLQAVLASVALAIAVLALGSAALAGPRPYDAPRIDPAHARVPPLPPEYLTEDGGWIRFSYHPAARERVRALATEADLVRTRLTADLGRPVLANVEVRVAAVPAEMARLSPLEAPPRAPVVAFSDVGLIVTSLASPSSLEPIDVEQALRHGLAHLALDEATGSAEVPRWLHEGFATHASGEGRFALVPALASAALQKHLLGLGSLEQGFSADGTAAPLVLAEATDVARFLSEEPRRDSFRSLARSLYDKRAFEPAMLDAYGGDLSAVEGAWRRDVARRYGFAPVLGGSLGLIAVVGGIATLRRIARRRALARAAEEREARSQDRAAARSARPRAITVGGIRIEEADEMGAVIPPEPEVPKVEHDGNWYTLH